MICANCCQDLTIHCSIHVIPCCPGKCPGQKMQAVDETAVFTELRTEMPTITSASWAGVDSASSSAMFDDAADRELARPQLNGLNVEKLNDLIDMTLTLVTSLLLVGSVALIVWTIWLLTN